jgi:hypothetical protein
LQDRTALSLHCVLPALLEENLVTPFCLHLTKALLRDFLSQFKSTKFNQISCVTSVLNNHLPNLSSDYMGSVQTIPCSGDTAVNIDAFL